MDQRVAELWVTALESGEYKQVEGLLAKVNSDTSEVEGYCCLGVLSDLAAKEGIIPPPVVVDKYDGKPPSYATDSGPDRLLFTDYEGRRSSAELPEAVREWAGLDESNPTVEMTRDNDEYDPDFQEGDDPWTEGATYTVTESLAEINDSHVSFTEIAKLIKDQLMTSPTAPTFAVDQAGEITEKSETGINESEVALDYVPTDEDRGIAKPEESYINALIPEDPNFSLADTVEAILTGAGTFVGGDADTDALLYGMRRAFASGVRYGLEFADFDTDEDEVRGAFDTFVLAEVVFATLLAEGGVPA